MAEAEGAALLVRVGGSGEQRRQHRCGQPLPDREPRQRDERQPDRGRERQRAEARRHDERPGGGERPLPEARGESADEPALHDHHHDPDVGEHETQPARAEAEAGLAEERERGLHGHEGQGGEERGGEEAADRGVVERVREVRPVHTRVGAPPRLDAARLGEAEEGEDEVGRGESRRGEGGGPEAEAGEEGPEGRAEDEPEADRGAEETHVLRPLAGGRHVGDVGLGRGNAAPEEPGQGARDEEQPQRAREARQQEGRRGAGEAHQQDGAAAETVGQPTEQRRAHELRGRVGGEDRAHPHPGGPERLGVVRQLRQDDAEADEVDEDGEVDDGQAGLQETTIVVAAV